MMAKRFLLFCILALMAELAWSQFSIDLSHIDSGVKGAAERARRDRQQGHSSQSSGYNNQRSRMTKEDRRIAETNAANAARSASSIAKTSSDISRVQQEAALLSGTHASDFFSTDLIRESNEI